MRAESAEPTSTARDGVCDAREDADFRSAARTSLWARTKGQSSRDGRLNQWAYRNDVQLKLIQSGKPTQNAYIESFNGRFRDECLNEHWFTRLAEARVLVAAWRRDYNEHRPHSSLDYQTPAEFAVRFRNATPRSEIEKEIG